MAKDWHPAIHALLYCIQFQDDPTQAVDHALRVVVARGALGRTPTEYRDAVVSALSSTEILSGLIPQPHPEDAIRRFLELLLSRLSEGQANRSDGDR